jgi:polyisoprenoid-binding protein YceI
MKRLLIAVAIVFASHSLLAETTRYLIRPTYTNIRFSIVKWGVLKQEGMFRDFAGTLDYDPEHPERARIDVIVQTASLDTKNENRDKVVRSDDLSIHGVTRPMRIQVTSHGIRELPNIGKLAGFETSFTINRRDYGVLGSRWGAIPGVLGDDVEIHILIGATTR